MKRVFLSLVALCLVGCGPSEREAIVRPARAAVTDAADVLAKAQSRELGRIEARTRALWRLCPPEDSACRMAGVDQAFADERAVTDRLSALAEDQHVLAFAIDAYDTCRESGGPGQEACEARALATLKSLAPKLRALAAALRKELSP